MPDLDLVHRKLSPRLFFSIGKQGRLALQEAELFRPPLLLIHGDADSVTCHRATERFFARCSSADKVLHLQKGAFHETHNDLCREQVITLITNWIEERL
jgi:alpha-beta hydrolase superfamily lysophospholipase